MRKLNAQVRKVIEWLPHDSDYQCNFYCECGCCESVQLTIKEYDALAGSPVHLAGHLTTSSGAPPGARVNVE